MFSSLQTLQAFGLGQQQAQQRAEQARKEQGRAALSEYLLARRQPRASSHSFTSSIGNNPPDPRVVGQPPATVSYGPGEDPTAHNMLAAGEQAPVQAPQQSITDRLAQAGQRLVDPSFERLVRGPSRAKVVNL